MRQDTQVPCAPAQPEVYSQILHTGSVLRTRGRWPIQILTVVGQIEGHSLAPDTQKTTKYEHVIPQLAALEEDPATAGLLVILNTVGGDVEAGLALAELVSGLSKPSAALVLGGGHSIGIPLAVSAQRSFIVPTATMTVHPVRHAGLLLGVPETMAYFAQMQQRITGFVCRHSRISPQRFTQLMMHTGQLVMDVGTVLTGEEAVQEGLIDEMGTLSDALDWLYGEIERRCAAAKPKPAGSAKPPAQKSPIAKRAAAQKQPAPKPPAAKRAGAARSAHSAKAAS